MTVSSALNRKEYAGDAATTVFATSPVVFFDDGDLDVYVVVDATGVATLKTITTHYTVTGGDGAAGTVTMTSAPAVGETLLILRVMAITQESDFVNNDPSDAEVAEDALDKLTMIAQQQDEAIGRALLLNVSSGLTNVEIPDFTDKAGYIMTVNDDEDGFELVSAITSTTTASAFVATLLDDTTAAAFMTTLGVSAFAQTILDDANAAAARTTLGLDTMATQAASAVAITGGSLAGMTAGTFTALTVSTTLALPAGSVTGTMLAAGATATNATLQNTTSGTAINFTGIPSGTKHITVMGSAVSMDDAGLLAIQIGPSGGLETSGYVTQTYFSDGAGAPGAVVTTNFGPGIGSGSTRSVAFRMDLTLQNASTNTWVAHGIAGENVAVGFGAFHVATKSLAGPLALLSMISSAGAFDVGTINISYQ